MNKYTVVHPENEILLSTKKTGAIRLLKRQEPLTNKY